MSSNLIYGIQDKPHTLKEWILYPAQQVFAVLTATLLISTICGTPLDAGMAAAGIGTLVYLILTSFKSPMFVSNAGGTVSAVMGAIALSNGNYLSVIIGGAITALLYIIVAIAIKRAGVNWINRLLPPIVVGSVIMVIGINLAKFAPTYVLVNGEYSIIGVLVALFVMFITAITAKYGKGFLQTIPFLVALAAGYILCLILELFGIHLINFSAFNNLTIFSLPKFAFLNSNISEFNWTWIPQLIILFMPTSLVLLVEHLGDHKSLSAVIGTDLITTPGLHRTLLGDGCASFIGTIIGAQPNTSYGESISCTAVSKVGSTYVIGAAAGMMILASFFRPLMALFESIPSCIFGGISLIAYGYIAFSGLNTLLNSNINYNNTGNIMVVASILTIGIGGLAVNFGIFSFSGVSLAMIIGVIMNLIVNKNSKRANMTIFDDAPETGNT